MKQLTKAELEEIKVELKDLELDKKSGACIDVLLIVQKHRKWISDDAISAIASYLEMSEAEVDSVATFYNQIHRKPVGQNVLRICDSVSCWIMGYDKVCGKIKDRLDIIPTQTTKDGVFTLINNQCLGQCDQAPVMMYNDDTLGNLLSEDGWNAVLKRMSKDEGQK